MRFSTCWLKDFLKRPFQAANKLQLFSPECAHTQLFSFSCQSAADDKFAAPQQNANCASVPILLPGGVPNMSFKRTELPLQRLKKKKRKRKRSYNWKVCNGSIVRHCCYMAASMPLSLTLSKRTIFITSGSYTKETCCLFSNSFFFFKWISCIFSMPTVFLMVKWYHAQAEWV